MPALADRLFSWTVPIERVEGKTGLDWGGGEGIAVRWVAGGRGHRDGEQFQHVVPAN